MPITYTNRKGATYHLCQSTTKTGKPRYHFAREQKGEPVDEIPEGFEIGENVNALVFVRKVRQMLILPQEIAEVEAAVKKHPKSRNYRVSVKPDRIEIHKPSGTDVDEVFSFLKQANILPQGKERKVREVLEKSTKFAPVLRFILLDAEQRTFRAERMRYGRREGWGKLAHTGPVKQLARQLVPTLDTDAFFELV